MRILEQKDIQQKIRRLAYQILEEYIEDNEIYIFGINNNGNKLKDELIREISSINKKIKIHSHTIRLSPADPLSSEIKTDINLDILNNKNLLIIDDVASTGRTLYYATSLFQSILPKSIKVGVLVDRKHKSFPIHVNFVGRSLATTINENILVFMAKKDGWYATIS
ncbi:MAG: phosphoribosyltransferase family protein [Saprospiraceae bacterium]